jgi:inhibitor of cysteine peptidase
MQTLWMLALAVAGFLAEDAPKPKVFQLTEAHRGRTVEAAVGKPFDIALEGNATTGFEWQLSKFKSGAVRQEGEREYVQKKNPKGLVGVGGTYVFHFKAVKAGKTKIKLVYRRPFEDKDTPPEKTFEVTIEVK